MPDLKQLSSVPKTSILGLHFMVAVFVLIIVVFAYLVDAILPGTIK